MDEPVIRLIEASEIEATARMWQDSQRAAYLWFRDDQWHPFDSALTFFRDSICERCDVWVALNDQRIVGMLALEDAYLDHLFVAAHAWGAGVGGRLLDHAKRLHPTGLELVTLRQNHRARRFYEARGFKVIAYGISPPPESEPDVSYRWSPDG